MQVNLYSYIYFYSKYGSSNTKIYIQNNKDIHISQITKTQISAKYQKYNQQYHKHPNKSNWIGQKP